MMHALLATFSNICLSFRQSNVMSHQAAHLDLLVPDIIGVGADAVDFTTGKPAPSHLLYHRGHIPIRSPFLDGARILIHLLNLADVA